MSDTENTRGYGGGTVDTVLSVDAVAKGAAELKRRAPSRATIDALAQNAPFLSLTGIKAGYGRMEILHGVDLAVAKGQSICLIGPNGAGKSTVLHTIFGMTTIGAGTILIGGQDVTHLPSNKKLSQAGIAYILQDNSVFPQMTVEENLLMGGYLLASPRQAKQAAERVFDKYERLARRKNQRAGVLSGGERRLLEISRALIMDPAILLVDEPSIGLEPRFIDQVFDILTDLQRKDGKTVVMVEQNARKGLEFADLGYVLVAGEVALAGKGSELLTDPDVARLFLGG
jgi:branched-chain amino acid transport system ATP-binding protein